MRQVASACKLQLEAARIAAPCWICETQTGPNSAGGTVLRYRGLMVFDKNDCNSSIPDEPAAVHVLTQVSLSGSAWHVPFKELQITNSQGTFVSRALFGACKTPLLILMQARGQVPSCMRNIKTPKLKNEEPRVVYMEWSAPACSTW